MGYPSLRSLADIFGLWNNAKILSDKIADGTGCRVFAPDMLEGETPPHDAVFNPPPVNRPPDSTPPCSGDAVKPDNFYMITQPIGNKPFLTRMTEMAKTFGSVFTGIGVGWILKHTQERVGGVVQKVSPGKSVLARMKEVTVTLGLVPIVRLRLERREEIHEDWGYRVRRSNVFVSGSQSDNKHLIGTFAPLLCRYCLGGES